MFKSTALGILTTALVLITFGYLIGTFAPAEPVMVGDPGWRQQHDQITSINFVKILTIVGWAVAALFGGFAAAWKNTSKPVRASAYLAALIILIWALPTTVIAGSTATWVHFSSVAVIIPFAILGGFAASKMRT